MSKPDLVTRLKDFASDLHGNMTHEGQALNAAANAIEELRKALVEIRDHPITRQSITAMVLQDIARAVLEETD